MRMGWLLLVLPLLAACGGGGSAPLPPVPLEGAPILLLAAETVVPAVAWDGTGVDLAPLGLAPDQIDGAFRLTTPLKAFFRFEVATTNGARLAIAHAAGGGSTEELTKAGFYYATRGGGTYTLPMVGGGSPWFEALPDDIERIEIGGRIDAPQVVVVRAGDNYALIFLDEGSTSTIHPPPATLDDATPLQDSALASAFNDAFGQPAVATLAGAPAVTWLSRDEGTPTDPATYLVRARVETPPPAGSVPVNAPGHATAGIQQDLLIARTEGGTATIEYSPSAGAAFDPPLPLSGPGVVRHPALAAAPGTFALAFWRDLDLVLVEGSFPPLLAGPERVVFTAPEGSLPLRPSVAISGDVLAVAYAFARADVDAGLHAIDVSTTFRCLVRSAGKADADLPVTALDGISRGPGVAVADDGRVLCAVDGIRVFERDQGAFAFRESLGVAGAHSPRLFVRGAGVDALYLQPTARGTEVHRATSPGTVQRITVASREFRTNGPYHATSFPVYKPQNESIPWIGYEGYQAPDFDAVIDETGDLVVAVHEENLARLFFVLLEPGRPWGAIGGGLNPGPPPRVPLPDDPAMTGSLAKVYDLDRHQLHVLRFAN